MPNRLSLGTLAALLCVTLSAQAAALTPYQQSALNKLLASMPAEQRALARPQLEAMVSRLGKAEIDMMLAKMAQAPAQAQNEGGGNDGEWGKAEADYAAAFPKVQAYIGRVSDARDRMTARWDQKLKALEDEFQKARANTFVDHGTQESCQRALNLIPQGRARLPDLAETHAEQDRILTRLLVENRAGYPNVEAYASTLGVPVDNDMVLPARYHWAAPLAEAEVLARFGKLETDMLGLLETNTRELHRIYTTAYPDQGAGVVSKLRERDLEAHRSKSARAASALCAPAYEAYTRGLVQWLAPIASKLKR